MTDATDRPEAKPEEQKKTRRSRQAAPKVKKAEATRQKDKLPQLIVHHH